MTGGDPDRLGGDSGLQREAFEGPNGRTALAVTGLDPVHWAEHCSVFDH